MIEAGEARDGTRNSAEEQSFEGRRQSYVQGHHSPI